MLGGRLTNFPFRTHYLPVYNGIWPLNDDQSPASPGSGASVGNRILNANLGRVAAHLVLGCIVWCSVTPCALVRRRNRFHSVKLVIFRRLERASPHFCSRAIGLICTGVGITPGTLQVYYNRCYVTMAKLLVRVERLELPRPFGQRVLSASWLPLHHTRI